MHFRSLCCPIVQPTILMNAIMWVLARLPRLSLKMALTLAMTSISLMSYQKQQGKPCNYVLINGSMCCWLVAIYTTGKGVVTYFYLLFWSQCDNHTSTPKNYSKHVTTDQKRSPYNSPKQIVVWYLVASQIGGYSVQKSMIIVILRYERLMIEQAVYISIRIFVKILPTQSV